MSWRSRDEFFHRLESQVQDGSLTLDQLLKEENFLNALGQQLPNISNFVASHVKELIEVAIGLEKPTEGIESKRYLLALVSHNTQLTDSFSNNEEIVNFLANSIHSQIDYNSYFRILQYAIESGDFLNKIENPAAFFNALVDQIQNSSVFNFLITLCTKRIQPSIDWLTSVEADKVLLSRMYSEEQTVSSCLVLLNKILDNTETNPLIKRICTLENYNLIFDTGIDAPTAKIAQLSFRLLIQIINRSEETTTAPDQVSVFESIMDKLDSTCSKLCEYVLRDTDFLGDKFAAIELIKSIVDTQKIEPIVFDVAKFLFELFFKQPTNTFLHRSFLKLFQSILSLPSGYKEFIEKEQIIEKIIYEHENQTYITATFHGFLIQMATSISACSCSEEIKAPKGWKNFIDKVVLPTRKRYNTNYGGRVPRTLLDTMGDGSRFIDEVGKIEDDNDDFVDVESDSSYGEEEDKDADFNLESSDDEQQKKEEKKDQQEKENPEQENKNEKQDKIEDQNQETKDNDNKSETDKNPEITETEDKDK